MLDGLAAFRINKHILHGIIVTACKNALRNLLQKYDMAVVLELKQK